MKSLKINLLLIVALLVTAATVSAFTMLNNNQPEQSATLETIWYFTGSEAQILEAELWRNTGSTPEDCAVNGPSPCSISVLASNQGELEDFLSQYTAGEVADMSTQKRP